MPDGAVLTAIDDFRLAQRLPSRAATMRELLRRGLAAQGYQVGLAGVDSRSFGVIESPMSSI
jgi:hypothetical protein